MTIGRITGLGIAALGILIGLIVAARGLDESFRLQGWIVVVLGLAWIAYAISRDEKVEEGYADDVIRAILAVDPELVRPVEVVLPPVEPAIAGDAQPTLDAWGSSNGYVFEW